MNIMHVIFGLLIEKSWGGKLSYHFPLDLFPSLHSEIGIILKLFGLCTFNIYLPRFLHSEHLLSWICERNILKSDNK